jgi:uncharacterized protein YyaL (SSP411 family)
VAHLLSVLLAAESGMKEVAIVGDPTARAALEAVVWQNYRPDCVVASGAETGSGVPLLQNRGTAASAAAAHVCRSFVCDLPVTTPEALRSRLDG